VWLGGPNGRRRCYTKKHSMVNFCGQDSSLPSSPARGGGIQIWGMRKALCLRELVFLDRTERSDCATKMQVLDTKGLVFSVVCWRDAWGALLFFRCCPGGVGHTKKHSIGNSLCTKTLAF
jgi:hypothetical protein